MNEWIDVHDKMTGTALPTLLKINVNTWNQIWLNNP